VNTGVIFDTRVHGPWTRREHGPWTRVVCTQLLIYYNGRSDAANRECLIMDSCSS